MTYNKSLSKVQVGSVVKDGKNVVLSVATKTAGWTRSEEQAKAQAPGFMKAVVGALDKIKPDTVEVVQRETQHTSPNDSREHYTGMQFNAKNEGHSDHFPANQ